MGGWRSVIVHYPMEDSEAQADHFSHEFLMSAYWSSATAPRPKTFNAFSTYRLKMPGFVVMCFGRRV